MKPENVSLVLVSLSFVGLLFVLPVPCALAGLAAGGLTHWFIYRSQK